MRPVGVVLAGGQARRLGADKPLAVLAGKPLLSHVLARIAPQVDHLVLSANGDPARFAAWPLPVVADSIEGQPGPLAGILAGLQWASATHPQAPWILSVPADTPFLPKDLVSRLLAAAPGHDVVLASRNGWTHSVIGLWSPALTQPLEDALRQGARKVDAWARRFPLTTVAFDEGAPIDPFLNINTPDDLEAAETYCASTDL